jgi:predicted MFS family arabinose efflux permease
VADLAEPSLLRRRPVVGLLAAEVVSTTGAQMTWLALPWFVLVTTGSATRPSVMTVNVMLIGLAQPLGVVAVGPILDRFGPQPVLVAFALVQTVAATLVAVASFAVRRLERTNVPAYRIAA